MVATVNGKLSTAMRSRRRYIKLAGAITNYSKYNNIVTDVCNTVMMLVLSPLVRFDQLISVH